MCKKESLVAALSAVITLKMPMRVITAPAPDIVSIHPPITDYYTYDKVSGKWIWRDDYETFISCRAKNTKVVKGCKLKKDVEYE